MTLRRDLLTVPVLLCGLAPLARAQPPEPITPASPEACHGLEVDAARLACYDQVFGRAAASAPAGDALPRPQAAAADAPADTAAAVPLAARVRELFATDLDPDQAANAGRGSLLDRRWELARDSKLGVFQLRAYKPVYLLPAFWTGDKNTTPASPNPRNTVTEPQLLNSTELKFQLSFKTKVVENLFGDNGDLWMGYTQSSRWQSYNIDDSRPFRETNYEPEAILAFRNNYSLLGWKGRMTAIHFNHQSNGRSDPLSRSWNRVILDIGLDRDNWALMLRPWYRVPEGGRDDNNPDIDDYMGRGDATLVWNRNGHMLSLMARHSLRGGERSHGALQVDYGFPLSRQLRGHVQVFDGYGESLIDYNHKATYVGLGLSLLDWF